MKQIFLSPALNIKVSSSPEAETLAIRQALAKHLRCCEHELPSYKLYKRSIDARRELQIHVVLEIQEEKSGRFQRWIRRHLIKAAAAPPEWFDLLIQSSNFNSSVSDTSVRPVVVGMGPAGLFAALCLAKAGKRPILVERGRAVEDRIQDFDLLRTKAILDPNSNAQFGEGGAGTFSDGKLTCRKGDALIELILKELVSHGAPEDILYEHKPHIGSDLLPKILRSIRHELLDLGASILFSHQLIALKTRDGQQNFAGEKNASPFSLMTPKQVKNKLEGILLHDLLRDQKVELACEHLVLAIGHSSRDTVRQIYKDGVCLEAKAFAMGFRIEHDQEWINQKQYRDHACSRVLGSAPYSLTVHPEDRKKAVYSFCMCPGGEVILASSEPNRLCVNGMSGRKRDKSNANAAILVTVDSNDYGDRLFSGLEFQERIEEKAYHLGGTQFCAPVQSALDFVQGEITHGIQACVQPSYRPKVKEADLGQLYPTRMTKALREGLILMDQRMPGFLNERALLTAAETRSSSPLRMTRDPKTRESLTLLGVYPAGEGAGYSGGIVSSAVDGLKSALALLNVIS